MNLLKWKFRISPKITALLKTKEFVCAKTCHQIGSGILLDHIDRALPYLIMQCIRVLGGFKPLPVLLNNREASTWIRFIRLRTNFELERIPMHSSWKEFQYFQVGKHSDIFKNSIYSNSKQKQNSRF